MIRVRIPALLLASALLVLAPAARAADDEEAELALLFSSKAQVSAVSKSREPEDIREAAAQVTVVSGEEIRAFGYRTLAELLETVPEAFVGGDRLYQVAGIRGFARAGDYNTRVLLLLDGHAVNEPWNNYAPIGTDFPIDLSQVERVEIIAGPVSALYGSNAFFGAINVVTRRPQRQVSGGAYAAGTGGWNEASAWYGDGAPGDASTGGQPWHVVTWAKGRISSGENLHFREFQALPSGGTERGTDWDRNAAAYFRMTRGPVSISTTAYGRRKGIVAGQYDAAFGDDRNWAQDARAAADVSLSVLERKNVDLRFRLYGDVYRYEDRYRYDPDPVFLDVAVSQWGGGEGILEWRAGPSNLVVSIENAYHRVSQDAFERQGTGTSAPDPARPINAEPADVRTFMLTRGSLHETLRLGENVRLVGGLYAENHEIYGLALAPRGGIVAHPWKGGTWKALYGRGFRSPSIYEAFFDDGDSLTGNPDLEAETVDGYELSGRQSVGKSFEAFATAFHGDYRNLIETVDGVDVDPDPVGEDLRQQYQNRERVLGSGVTAGFKVRAKDLVLRVDGSGFRYADEDGVLDIAGSPEWVAHAVALLPIDRGRASLAARVSAVGARPARDGGRLSPYAVADLAFRVRRVWKDVGVAASVTNLFDARYGQPAGDEYVPAVIPGYGRRVFVELRWER